MSMKRVIAGKVKEGSKRTAAKLMTCTVCGRTFQGDNCPHCAVRKN